MGLCQRKCLEEKTQVWNLESQKELFSRPMQKSPKKKPNLENQVALDWNRRRRMDSYFVEGTTQTVIRQEIYEKILLQQKSPFFTKDLFTISMRNVNERIINERRIIVPARSEKYSDAESSLEIANFNPASEIEVEVQVETPPKESVEFDSATENSEREVDAKVDLSRSSGSGRSDPARGEDLETVVTDVEEDSLGNAQEVEERRLSCTAHEGDSIDMTQFRIGDTR